MGTRAEIRIASMTPGKRGWRKSQPVVLFKHYDGYPSFMLPLIFSTANYAREYARDQIHWLCYETDVSSYLIACHWDDYRGHMKALGYDNYPLHPDIRPMGSIDDFVEYVYEIRLYPGSPNHPPPKDSAIIPLAVYWEVEFSLAEYDYGNLNRARSLRSQRRLHPMGKMLVRIDASGAEARLTQLWTPGLKGDYAEKFREAVKDMLKELPGHGIKISIPDQRLAELAVDGIVS